MKVDPYATKVLDPAVHGRLVADLDAAAFVAGIQPRWIWTPLKDAVSTAEFDWVRKFKFHVDGHYSGMAYVGPDTNMDVEVRMAAIAGALTRNFINARMMQVSRVVDLAKDGDLPKVSCLLIPNLFLGKANGGHLPSWAVSVLLEALQARRAAKLQTVIYVSDYDALGAEYGKMFRNHVESDYWEIVVG